MERNYLLGGLLTLIALGVLIVIMVSIFPGFGEEVKQIADDVFNIPGNGEFITQQSEDKTKGLMGSISKAFDCAAKKESADRDGCICQIEYEEMPENYYIELIKGEDQKYVLKSYNPSGKLLDDTTLPSKINNIYYQSIIDNLKTDDIIGGGKFYYEDDVLILQVGRDKEELRLNTPIYVNEKNQIIMLTSESKSDISLLNKIQTQNLCGEREFPIKEQAISYFKTFVDSYDSCLKTESPEGKVYCQCRRISIYEPELPQAFEIKINPKKTGVNWNTTFTLITAADKKIVLDSENKPVARTLDKFFQQEEEPVEATNNKPEPQYKYYDPQSKLQNNHEKWVFIKYHTEAGVQGGDPKSEGDGVIFSPEIKAEDIGIPHCLSASQKLSSKGCVSYEIKPYSECSKSFKDTEDIWSRISKGTDNQKTDLGNTYLQVMQNKGFKECDQYLLSGVIAAESEGYNKKAGKDVKSSTGCLGLMQFCKGSAADLDLCVSKTCASDDKRGDPELSIPAGWQLLQNKRTWLKNSCKTDLDISGILDLLAVAAYNGGEGTMCAAVKALGKDNPTWDELRTVINGDLLEKISSYRSGYFDSDSKRETKAKEIRCYPYYVYQYRDRMEGFAA